jgi:hypothetical protein
MQGNKIRNGKIAKLPNHIREELNSRLHNGESGVHVTEWLNGLPEVQATLDQHFGGRKIKQQNMTEWRQGGYAEWLHKRLAVPVSGEAADGNLNELRSACQRVVANMMIEWMSWYRLSHEHGAAAKLN